jgi:SAM-dependent methyltransferase
VVLDLGSGAGSFPAELCPGFIVRCDLRLVNHSPGDRVCAAAHALPFGKSVFDLAVLNHSLEHFQKMDDVLDELGRTIKPAGGLYVAVPDASTLSDKLYRWIGNGGGHINPFVDAGVLAGRISAATGLPLRGIQTLFTGYSFLNRGNTPRRQRKLLLLGGGNENLLRIATLLLRGIDRVLNTRLSIYGWAFYFGAAEPDDQPAMTNVCIRCGACHPASWLEDTGRLKRKAWLKAYPCPLCSCWNYWTRDFDPA